MKNLKHEFRSELIRQRRSAKKFGGRDKMKTLKGGKYADYGHIYSDKSYMTHLGRARKFAEYCKDNGIRKFDEITPNIVEKYLLSERDSGLSASTIGADALCINHLMIGSGAWNERQKIEKAKIAQMPKRSSLIAKQREKPLNSREWREQYAEKYLKYKDQIDTIRAFGFRRRELTGGTSRNGRDALGDRSLYRGDNGRLYAITQGKGGKIRWVECRQDMEKQMYKLYGEQIRPISERPHNKQQFEHNLKINKPFYKPFSHGVPTHIFRADYAQNKLQELDQYQYSGKQSYSYYRRARLVERERGEKYIKETRFHDLSKEYQIGAYKASYGAFYKLSHYMGHNRLDVLNSYLGVGR